jgi:hypothetical protein
LAERLLCKERVRSSSLLVSTTSSAPSPQSKISGPPETAPTHNGPARRAADRAPDPCPAAAGRPPTSGSLGDGRCSHRRRRGLPVWGAHLNNWIVFGRNEESSISPSSQGNDPDGSHPVTGRLVRCWRGSSYKGHGVDALAPRADEGRGRLRKASGSREQTVIRRCPNGETRLG